MPSPLDQWALKNHNVLADQLDPDGMRDLVSYVLDAASDDKQFWRPRDDRFMEDQSFWEIGTRYSEITKEDDELQAAEIVELNDGYTIVDKVTSMCVGAGWGMDVPPRNPELDDIAQDIEDMLRWAEEEIDARRSMALNSTILRDEVHYAALRGWLTGLLIPNPEDPELPWTYLLEDPLFVYPRYTKNRLVRVNHVYTMTALEARDEFPEAGEYLLNLDDDDEVEVTTYYDDTYKVSLLANALNATNNPFGSLRDAQVIQPLVRHGYVDINGTPVNPWIIVVPRGTPTRRFDSKTGKGDLRDAVAFIGLGVLHPIKEMIRRLERLASMMHTEVAKGVNPPRLIFFDGANKPEPLDIGPGAENYFIMQVQDAKILESTAMKPDAGPLLQIYTERIQKASFPDTAYGRSLSGISGYAVNLLNQGARDITQPILDGVKRFRDLRHRRMLEMYVNIGSQFAGPLAFRSLDREQEQVYTGMKTITPEHIKANGVFVNNHYDSIFPREAGALMASAAMGIQAGILPLYDAMKDWVGIKDPKQALRRLAEGINYQDPRVKMKLARQAGLQSGNADLRTAVTQVVMEEQLMLQMQQAGMAPPTSTGLPPTEPLNQQPNPEQNPQINPMTRAANQMNAVSGTENVQNGANPPADIEGLLSMLGLP